MRLELNATVCSTMVANQPCLDLARIHSHMISVEINIADVQLFAYTLETDWGLFESI